jgi:hypothetical protein
MTCTTINGPWGSSPNSNRVKPKNCSANLGSSIVKLTRPPFLAMSRLLVIAIGAPCLCELPAYVRCLSKKANTLLHPSIGLLWSIHRRTLMVEEPVSGIGIDVELVVLAQSLQFGLVDGHLFDRGDRSSAPKSPSNGHVKSIV